MTAVGYNALLSFTPDTPTHGWNTAMGYESGKYVLTGTSNTFFGSTAGRGVDGAKLTGDQNTALGDNAGGFLQGAATQNTLVGAGAGDSITTGTTNTVIGNSADTSAVGSTNQTVIGQGTTGYADNTVTLGNTSAHSIIFGSQRHLIKSGTNAISDNTTETFTISAMGYGMARFGCGYYSSNEYAHIEISLGGTMSSSLYNVAVLANFSTANLNVTLTKNASTYTIAIEVDGIGDALLGGWTLESINYTGVAHATGSWA